MADFSARDTAIKFGMGRFRLEENLLEDLGEEISRFGSNLLIITSPHAWEAVKARLIPALSDQKISYKLEIATWECSKENAQLLAKIAHASSADVIVGIGGGKCIDLAKATGELAGLGVVLIPTNMAQCASGACTSVMYTPEGGKDVTWRYSHEVDAVYIDLNVIAASPVRYLAAGIVDAMAKKIEILDGRPSLELTETEIDLYTAYNLAAYTYNVMNRLGDEAIQANRNHRVTKALKDIVFMTGPITGVLSNITRGYNQVQIAHTIYDGVRTLFTKEAAAALHGEIVAVGLFCQLYLNGLQEQEAELREILKRWQMPQSLAEIGIEPTETNLQKLESYIMKSRHYKGTTEADRQNLRLAIREMA